MSGFPGGWVDKESACISGDAGRCVFDPQAGKIPWRRAWQPILVFFTGKFPWTEEPGGLYPWGHKELDMTE